MEVVKNLGRFTDCHLGKSKYTMKNIYAIDNMNNNIECFIIY